MHIRTFAFLALLLAAPALGESVRVAHLHPTADQEANYGVHMFPSGPEDLPLVYGGTWEIMGASTPLLVNSGWARYSSGTATFDRPVSKVEFTVARGNDSRWMNMFTLEGMNDGKTVADKSVNLQPVGDKTHITISADAIDQIKWSGNGWVFHPYDVTGMKLTYAAVSSAPDDEGTVPKVGGATDVPEPGTAALGGILIAGLLRRPRRK